MPVLAGGPGRRLLGPGCAVSPLAVGGAATTFRAVLPRGGRRPGSPRNKFAMGPLLGCGYMIFSGSKGGPMAGRSVLPTPAPKAARLDRTFCCGYPPLGADVG